MSRDRAENSLEWFGASGASLMVIGLFGAILAAPRSELLFWASCGAFLIGGVVTGVFLFSLKPRQ